MEENLICSICHDIQHNPIAAIPCLHSFCGGCISEWSDRSQNCPLCKVKIESYHRNFGLKSIVEAFLLKYPDKKRDKEELDELDEIDTVLEDQKKKSKEKKQSTNLSSDEDESKDETGDEDEDEDEDESSESSDTSDNLYVKKLRSGKILKSHQKGATSNYQKGGKKMIPQGKCRECLSARKSDGFQCDKNDPQHYKCSGCTGLFPRRTDVSPVIKCEFCKLYFCDNYYPEGCYSKIKLQKVKKHPFDSIPMDCFNNNRFERNIFVSYLNYSHIRYRDFHIHAWKDLDSNKYSKVDLPSFTGMNSNTVLCSNCFKLLQKEIIYAYRVHIPKDELPKQVTRRDDCWYGKNCRTQVTNINHARRLNHICEQTKY